MTTRLTRRVSSKEADIAAGGEHWRLLLFMAISLCVLIWAFWIPLTRLFKDWQNDQNYSVGQLVPLVAIYLVWRRRKQLARLPVSPCWWGLGLILAGQLGSAFGLMFLFESAERYAFLLTLVGVLLLLAGRPIVRNLAWVILFLFLMVPLPGRVHDLISEPLQSLATQGAVFMLEVFGVTVSRHGHQIILNHETPLFVAEACSGLRMLTAFIVVAATFNFLVNRPPWQKAVLLLSSIPIAVACNLVRLCITAVLYMVASSELAEAFFHDFAGWLMMPLAILALVGEVWILDKLVIPDADARGASKTGRKHDARNDRRPAAEAIKGKSGRRCGAVSEAHVSHGRSARGVEGP